MAKIYTTLFNEVLGDCQYLKAGRSIIYLLFRKFGFNTTRIATQCGAGEGGATQYFRCKVYSVYQEANFSRGKGAEAKMNLRLIFIHSFSARMRV